MRAFGICIPMWAGADTHEGWHIQPEETLAYTGDKAAFMPAGGDIMLKQGDNNPQVLAWQNGLVTVGFPLIAADSKPAVPNSNFGPATLGATSKFLASVGLPQTGTVDGPAWAAMANALRAKAAAELVAQKVKADLLASRIQTAKQALG